MQTFIQSVKEQTRIKDHLEFLEERIAEHECTYAPTFDIDCECTGWEVEIRELKEELNGVEIMTADRPMSEPNKEQEPLPEAPVSVHIDGYYKGFHVGITQRDPNKQEQTFLLVGNAKKLIELMEKDGWKPSWNGETNRQFESNFKQKSGSQAKENPFGNEEDPQFCLQHKKKMKKREDKRGRVFYSHARKNQDEIWEYCSGSGFPSEW